jgi:para-nitrobenzyl esterase
MQAFRDGTAHRVPLIIGTNDREGTIFRGRIDILPRSVPRVEAVLARGTREARELMVRAYPGLPAGAHAADFGGDYAFWYPCVAVAERHSRYAPVYFYRFDVAPRLMRLAGLDATHGLELFALFEQADSPLARTMTSLGGRKVFSSAGARMRDAWLSFADAGTPPEWWPRYSEGARLTLIIADPDRVEADPRADRRRAWSALLPFG